MPIATGLALLIGGLAAAGGSAAAAKIGSNASKSAAETQATATQQSVDAQLTAQRETNALTEKMFNEQQASLKPWLDTGAQAEYQLKDLLAPGGQLTQGFNQTFDSSPYSVDPSKYDVDPSKYTLDPSKYAFDPSKVQFDPGFQARMDASNKALQQWAASKGEFFSGGTGAKIVKNAQDLTSQEYDAAYNREVAQNNTDYSRALNENQSDYSRALDESQANYGRDLTKANTDYAKALTDWENAKGTFNENQNNLFNRLSTLAGTGQSATNASNANETNATTALINSLMQTTQGVNSANESAAAARAAAQVGSANAIASGIGNTTNALSSSLTLASLLNPSQRVIYNPNQGGTKAPVSESFGL